MSFDNLRQDLRLAVRSVLRAPAFSAVTILTLALGIGANTAIFSIVNGVILRPLPYPSPERLMYLTTQFPSMGFTQFWVSPPEYFEFRELNQSFAAVGAYTTGEVNLTAGDRPLRVRSAGVDDALLDALGLQPLYGRLFNKGETDVVPPPTATGPVPLPPVCILSYELWQSAFGGRTNVIGEMIEVNGLRREVIGIMPPGADVMDNRTEIWTPIGLNPTNRQNRGSHFLYLIGRLKDGVTPEMARTELATLIESWGDRTGQKNHIFRPLPRSDEERRTNAGHILQMQPLQEQIIGGAGQAIWVLQAAVGFVLLIACANLGNLLLARAETRHREFAVRTALGAGRGRLLRQFMTEGVLLSVIGGGLGLLLAHAGVRALIRVYPTSLPRTAEVAVDAAVLFFTFVIAIGTGLVFGLAPLAHTRVKGLVTALKEGGAKGATGAARHHVRRGLVVAEVALAVMLVIGAGLLIRTVYNLAAVDAAFDRARLVTFQMTLPVADYPQPLARTQLYQRLLERLRGTVGIQGATAMGGLPPNRPLNANDTEIGNYTPQSPDDPAENVDYYQPVMTNYFETMGIPIVKGRAFEAADVTSGPVVIVNETLVNTFWKDRDPIGQTLKPGLAPFAMVPDFRVIGVARDVKQGGVDRKTGTEIYLLIDQVVQLPPPLTNAPQTLNIVLRTTLPPSSLRAPIESIVREADPSVPMVRFRDMNGVFEDSIARPRLLAQLLGGFAGLALLLAAIGTYGVLSYMVAERRREIGIRMALGADQGSVLAQVMKQGLTLTTIGIAGGLMGAFALNRLVASLLYGVQPTDAATIVAVVTTITLVATVACMLPAWRASRVDPSIVLRDD
jgi:predicted permease